MFVEKISDMGIPFNNIANLVVVPLLRPPLHGLVSSHIMLISFTGRNSGIVFTTPVEYRREGKIVHFFTRRERVCWKNLLDHAPVTLRLRGHDVKGAARRLSLDEQVIIDYLLRLRHRMTYEQAVTLTQKMVLIEIELAEQPVTSVPAATRHPAR